MEDIQNSIDDPSCFNTEESPAAKIKVIGVGGGGCNALNYMYHQNIPYVSFAALNTDEQHLRHTIDVPTKLVLGNGLGAGDKPDVGRKAAEDSEQLIRELFQDQTEMVFVTAGMGGGTGTGAGPVIARIAREEKKLTIGIITIPFLFEGKEKIRKALDGAEEMRKYVDALLIINNQNLLEIFPDFTLRNAFRKADDTLANAARSISEIISEECYINVDMEDVRTTLQNAGTAIIATAYGEGEHRISDAISKAMHSPLLKAHDIMTAKRVLIKLTHADDADTDNPVKADELNELTEFTAKLSRDFNVKWGVGTNPKLGNKVKLTLLATGFDITLREATQNSGAIIMDSGAPADDPEATTTPIAPEIVGPYSQESLIKQQRTRAKVKYIILKPSQMDDDEIIMGLERTPAFNRDPQFRSLMEKSHTEPLYADPETKQTAAPKTRQNEPEQQQTIHF